MWRTTGLQKHLIKPLASCDKTAWAWSVAALVESLPGMDNTPRAGPQHQRLLIPASGGEVSESEVQGHSLIHRKFEASLDHHRGKKISSKLSGSSTSLKNGHP